MKPVDLVNGIPLDDARRLCAEIRSQAARKWYTLAGLQCAGCVMFSKGDSSKMCISSRPDFRGCNLVNLRYDGKPQARG